MTRRRAIAAAALAAAQWLHADDRTDALDAVAPLATALANSDPDGFASALPKDLTNRDEIRANVAALIAAAEVTSSVEVSTAANGTAELDWYMQIRSRATAMLVETRQGSVRIAWRRKKLTLLEPASFFAPPKLTPPADNQR